MSAAWAWIKRWWWAIVAALAFVGGLLAAISFKRSEITRLKVSAKVEKTKAEVVELKGKAAASMVREETLAEFEKEFDGRIEKHENQIERIEEDAERMDADEVATGFNQLYSDRNRE